MTTKDVRDNKFLGNQNPYVERIGINHLIDDIDANGKLMRWPGKLISVIGPNLLFEKANGIRILVDPTKITRIIELHPRGRQ